MYKILFKNNKYWSKIDKNQIMCNTKKIIFNHGHTYLKMRRNSFKIN